MRRLFVVVCVGILALNSNMANAQWTIGPHVVISTPETDFANIEGTGGGFGFKAIRRTGMAGGHLGLRGDFAFMTFGKRQEFDIIGRRIEFRNEGYRMTFGPELTAGTRKLRAYAGVNGGLYYFRVNVRSPFINSGGNPDSFFEQRENNWALGWNFGVGLQYDVGLGPWLDIGFEYQTMHNLPERIRDDNNPDDLAPIADVTAHEFTFKVGVTFFLGH